MTEQLSPVLPPANANLTHLPSGSTRRGIQKVCIWTGVPMIIMLMAGLVFAGLIPPASPRGNAAEIAATYREHTGQIRFWLAVSFLSIGFLFPFGAAIAAQTRRLEGRTPVLTYIQIAGLASGSLIFVIPWICWFVAAFRPERSDSEIQLVSDLGWITFVTAFIAFSAWLVAVGVAILSDPNPKPLFPRWLGYWNIFVAVSFVPDICVPFFKSGLLCWRGVLPFYFPFGTYLAWIIVMMIYTAKAINDDPELTEI